MSQRLRRLIAYGDVFGYRDWESSPFDDAQEILNRPKVRAILNPGHFEGGGVMEPVYGQCPKCGGNLAVCRSHGCPNDIKSLPEIGENQVKSFDIEKFILELPWSLDTPDIHKTLVAGNLRNLFVKIKEIAGTELTQLRVQLVATEARLREAEGLLHRILDPANHPPDPWYDVLMEITRFLTPPQGSAKIVEDRKQNKRPPCSEIALRLWTEAGEPPQDSTEAEPEMVCVRKTDLDGGE